ERVNGSMALGIECLDAGLAPRAIQDGKSDKAAGAVSRIAHNRRDGTRMRSGGDVEVGYALMAKRLRGEKARVPPVGRLHIPTGDAASNGSVRTARYPGAYQQDRANRRSVAFQEVTELRQSCRREVLGQSCKDLDPESPSPLRKAVCKEVYHTTDVALGDLSHPNL